MVRRNRRTGLAVLLAMLLALSAFVGIAANPNTETTTTNQDLTVEVTLDTTDDPVWLGTTVHASATANLGDGDTANVMYVVDVSGSMRNPDFNPPDPALGDCVGDGELGSALDAACLGLIALNESLGNAVNVNVGLVAYGDGAVTADVDPAPGEQIFTTPPDVDNSGTGVPDMEQVIRSLSTEFGGAGAAGVGLFTNKISNGFAFETDYDAALTQMNAAFATQPAGDINTAFFLSDGLPTTFTTGAGSPLQAAMDAGTTIHTFGVGGGATNSCNPGAPLRMIADQTGGSCAEVDVPGDLSTVLPATLTNIASLELFVNGVSVASVAGSEPVSMSLLNVDITAALTVGINTIDATATAEDGTVVTASTTLGVIDLELAPAHEVNELGQDNEHTVVATVTGDASQVAGILVDFEVQGQNAGAAGDCDPLDCRTDADGQVAFTYSVPVAPASLGTDTIVATATSPDGDTATREVTKEWEDTTPPVAACDETVNPSGNNVPRAGQRSPGQNEDGFYQLNAEDDVWPAEDLEIFVIDTGSGAEFGPFPVGTNVKYTQAPGAEPSISPMGGNNGQGQGQGNSVDWQIRGQGDMAIYAVDGSGNASDPIRCLVPPPPK